MLVNIGISTDPVNNKVHFFMGDYRKLLEGLLLYSRYGYMNRMKVVDSQGLTG